MSYKLGPCWDDVITWSDFKSKIIFGFLSPKYRGQHTAGLPMSYKLGSPWDDVIPWSDFKSETSFGFLSPNYTGHVA